MSQKRGIVVASVALATLMNGLDTTIVTIAMPTIVKDLGQMELYAWVVTAFSAAAAAFGPAWGRLSDFWGRRRLLISALVGFVAASIACGLAPSMVALIASRAVQGFFGGALFPLAYSVVADLYPPEERSRGVALINSVNAIAFAVGPILGALITEHIGWRWNFYVNVPILAVALFFIATKYREERKPSEGLKFDFSGMGLFSLAIGAFVTGLGLISRRAAWDSPLVLGLLGGTVLSAVAFGVRESRVDRPFIPLRFLRTGPFASSVVCILLAFSAFIGVMVFIPAYVQGVRGDSVQTMGFLQLSVVGGWFVTAALGGKLVPRVGARLLAVVGVAILLGGLVLLNQWTPESPMIAMVGTLVLIGAGVGFTQPPLFVLGQTSLPPTDQGLASGLLGVSANIGATMSTAAYGTLLTWSIRSLGGAALVAQVPLLMKAADREALRVSIGPDAFGSAVSSYGSGLHHVFAAELVPAAIAMIVLLVGLRLWGRGRPRVSS